MFDYLKFIIFITVLGCINISTTVFAKELTIFDKYGNPTAYIDTDEELTIYLWSGEPVAYLDRDSSIYGYNGKHLAWLNEGIIWNHSGYMVGFVEGSIQMLTKLEPFKYFKKFRPFKAFQEFPPIKPFFIYTWSGDDLTIFLSLGRA